MYNSILRGELYYADLSPVIGSEQSGVRPVLIIQNNVGNRHSPTVIVAAITSRATKATLPTHYHLNPNIGLEQDSIALLEQIRTIDKQRLKDYIGVLDHSDLLAIDKALAISIGLNGRKI